MRVPPLPTAAHCEMDQTNTTRVEKRRFTPTARFSWPSRRPKVAFTELKLALEPSGALGLAALLAGRTNGLAARLRDGDAIGVVACGGNVAVEVFARMVAAK